MSKRFEKLKKLIISLFLVITLCNFLPTESNASSWVANTLGGPILQFSAFLGDVTIGLLHKYILGVDKVGENKDGKKIRMGLTDSVLLYPDDPTITDSKGLLYAGDKEATMDNTFDMENFDTEVLGMEQRTEEEKERLQIEFVSGATEEFGSIALGIANPVLGIVALETGYMNLMLAASDYFSEITMDIPNIMVCPENIFGNKIAMFDVNFISPGNYGTGGIHVAQDLRGVVASWYRTFRNIAIVALLTILVYIGIRIIIGSTAQDKAKYKERLKDWFVGLCLVFAMHYIMAGILFVTNGVTKLLDKVNSNDAYIVQIDNVPGLKTAKSTTTNEEEEKNVAEKVIDTNVDNVTDFFNRLDNNSEGRTVKVKENLMGYVRLLAEQKEFGNAFGYSVMYIVLVIFTCMFVIKYIKRVLFMAFFTMIAPLVAMTYPLDKLADGKAQGFSMWFKEFLMNALIQPVHLIIYTIFVGTAADLVRQNVVYGIVVLAFMLPAEKLIRKMFRFDRGETTGSLGDIAGGALALQGLKSLASGGKSSSSNSSKGSSEKAKENKIRVNKDNKNYAETWQNAESSGNNAINDGLSVGNTRTQPQNDDEDDTDTNGQAPINPDGQTEENTSIFGNNNQGVPDGNVGTGTNGAGGAGINDGDTGDTNTNNSPNATDSAENDGDDPNSGSASNNTADNNNQANGIINPNITNVNAQRPQSNQTRLTARKGALKRTLLRGGAAVGKGLWDNKRKIIKGVARFYAGGAGALIGLSAGIATGDLSKVVASTTGGLMAGRAIGNKAVDASASVVHGAINTGKGAVNLAGNIANAYNEEAYGLQAARDIRVAKENERDKKAFMKNAEEKRKYHEIAGQYGYRSVEEVMNKAWDYKRAQVSDELIEKGLKLESKHQELSHEQMIAAMQIAGSASAETFRDQKKLKGLEQSTAAKIGGENSEERAHELIKVIAEAYKEEKNYIRTLDRRKEEDDDDDENGSKKKKKKK